MQSKSPHKNDRRELIGWLTYDWANSAFYTTVISVLVGKYLIALAEASLGVDAVVLDLGIFQVTTKGLFGFCIALSVILMVGMLPVLGAVADYTNLKKTMMAAFCYSGVLASGALFFVTESYIICGILIVVSNMCFAAANVFYNAYLIDITTEDLRDRYSSYGYGAGYLGGVVMLVLNILLINNAEDLGIATGLAVRISFLSAAVWWGAFALVTFLLLRVRGADKVKSSQTNLLTVGFTELGTTLKQLWELRHTRRFLIAYLFYNDGIQTVILQASVFISYELFTSRGIEADDAFLLMIFLVAQLSALAGAVVFERVSRLVGAKASILISLGIWCGIVIYAYAFFSTQSQAYFMASCIGIVLGAAQALSRSLYSQMIPKGRESAFFGLYEISEKGTSWMGQLMFVIIVSATNSYRQAILGLIAFFVIGTIVLLLTDVRKAIHDAGNLTPDEASALH